MRYFVGFQKNKKFGEWRKGMIWLVSVVLAIGGVWLVERFVTNSAVGTSLAKELEKTEKQVMKVLVVEMNPHLTTVEGQPKANDYFFGEYADAYPEERQVVAGEKRGISGISVNEQIDDLEFASHNYLEIEVEDWEYMDEFPRYMEPFTLPDGTTGYTFDDVNFLAAAGNTGGVSGWNNLYKGCWLSGTADCGQTTSSGVQAINPPASYSFDRGWFIDKLDLVGRRNDHEFDQVWLVSVDPSMSFETMMVGRNAYWINGPSYEADCDNFMIAGASPSRRDAQLHAMAHAAEHIMGGMDGVYLEEYDARREATEDTPPGKKPSYNISTVEEYLGLNPWERFLLNDYANLGTLNGVGTVHLPYNAAGDYDYANNKKVNTTYFEWQNQDIDAMDGGFLWADSSAWRSEGSLFYVPDFADYQHMWNPSQATDRFYARFWLYSFPHREGYTKDGYFKNWWKYLYSLNHATGVFTDYVDTDIEVEVGDTFELEYWATYQSGDTKVEKVGAMGDNVQIADISVVRPLEGEKFEALDEGDTVITFYKDGKGVKYDVRVRAKDGANDEDGEGGNGDNNEEGHTIASGSLVINDESLIAPDTGANTHDAVDKVGNSIAIVVVVEVLVIYLVILKCVCLLVDA